MADGSPSCVGKRTRKCNFTNQEVEVLVKLVNRHSRYIYGRTPLGVSTTKKRKAWDEVLRGVNALGIEQRTLSEIKNKWKKCKREMRGRRFDSINALLLQQRLPQQTSPQLQIPALSESLLQSQPLSPTKLKVTRGLPQTSTTSKPPEPSPADEAPEEVCLRWNSHHFNMQTSFPNLLQKEQYVDVTLAAEGKTLKCHRLILSSCSAYFEEILNGIAPSQHPVIFMKDIPFWILKSLCDFMYAGEVHIDQSKLEEMLHVAEALKIKGLGGKTNPPAPSPMEKAEQPPNTPQVQEQPPQTNQTKQPVAAHSLGVEQMTVDPLDLLQTSYLEESSSSTKQKDTKLLLRKTPLKKLRKRRSSQHEMSPPPLFHLRKGTRSRPNVKIPKYYHSEYEEKGKKQEENSDDSAAPLVQTVIKTEPIDVVDDVNYPGDGLENPQNPPVNTSGPLIITPVQNTEENKIETTDDGFFKITLSSKYLKENQDVMEQQVETNDNDRQMQSKEHDPPINKEEGDGNTEKIEAVNTLNKATHVRVPPQKRRGRKRKFRRGKAAVDSKNVKSLKKTVIETNLSPTIMDDEISESLERLKSTEGLEIVAEVADFDTPTTSVDVDQGEPERISENGILRITTPVDDALKTPAIGEEPEEIAMTIIEPVDEPTKSFTEENLNPPQQEETFIVTATDITDATVENTSQLPPELVTTTDSDEKTSI